MVTPEALDALDFLVWLNSGYRAAECCGCHQSSISRRAQEAADVFGLLLMRDRAGWRLTGPTALLDLEREVHQLHRLLRGSELRLELAPQWAGLRPRLASIGWIAVPAEETVRPERTRRLVESRVIDGWLTSSLLAEADGQDALAACALHGAILDGAALVVRRELVDHPAIHALYLTLQGSDGSNVEKRASQEVLAFRR